MNGAPVELVSNHNETNDRGQRSTALLECYDANEAQMKITCFIVEDSHRYLLVSSYRIIEQFGKPIEKLKVRIHFTDTPGSEPLVLTRTHYWLVWESDQKHMRTIILELTDTCVEWMRAQGCQFLTANEPCPLLKITLFQYPKDLVEKKLCCSSGEVIKVEAQSVFYSAGSGPGAEGGPIVNTGNSAVIGLHLEKCANPENGAQGIVNKGSSIDPIIKHYNFTRPLMVLATEAIRQFRLRGSTLDNCIEQVEKLLEALENTVWNPGQLELDKNFRLFCEDYMKVIVTLRHQLRGARYPNPFEMGDLIFGGGLRNIEQKTRKLFATLSHGKPINDDFFSGD